MERVFDIPKEINGTKHPSLCPSKTLLAPFWAANLTLCRAELKLGEIRRISSILAEL
jgi:hypothetical protein